MENKELQDLYQNMLQIHGKVDNIFQTVEVPSMLRNEYNNKVKTVLDRFDSLTGEAGQYNSFSGLADGMNGKVKFIFQTEEIKAED